MLQFSCNTGPLTGRQATKAEVMKRMSSVSLIHIAAHGNKRTGEIALSPNPGWTSKFPQRKDYILKMSDVQAANLRARLVVLSCCHSGRGRILKGEGVVGIARAFLAAGARSVLVTLWAIDDEATMVLRQFFSTSYGCYRVTEKYALKCLILYRTLHCSIALHSVLEAFSRL